VIVATSNAVGVLGVLVAFVIAGLAARALGNPR